jgi:hypothetical protein
MVKKIVQAVARHYGKNDVERERSHISDVSKACDERDAADLPVVAQVTWAQQQPHVEGGEVVERQNSETTWRIFVYTYFSTSRPE